MCTYQNIQEPLLAILDKFNVLVYYIFLSIFFSIAKVLFIYLYILLDCEKGILLITYSFRVCLCVA